MPGAGRAPALKGILDECGVPYIFCSSSKHKFGVDYEKLFSLLWRPQLQLRGFGSSLLIFIATRDRASPARRSARLQNPSQLMCSASSPLLATAMPSSLRTQTRTERTLVDGREGPRAATATRPGQANSGLFARGFHRKLCGTTSGTITKSPCSRRGRKVLEAKSWQTN